MKKTVFLVLAMAMVFTACEDDDIRNADIPSVVLNGFTEQFSNATGVEWEKKADLYEAEFEIEKVDYEAILSSDGTIVKYKYDVSYEALPEAVQASITADYDKTNIDEIELIQISEKSYYQVEFDAEPNDNKIIFEESGQVTTQITTW
ncbi:PepSY-like domain-containing protein [Salegentibacter mishustinae]|uniref:PepSY-like domain-containing protein n=1 Tax=Salegentibacter mishustinae TaxID=270918 RepID=UPI001CE18954|nr:PepSY-like domain-containing protein [Salegentibacter mishustinae]UBZ07299.1 PepSY-like domain-containing protein [Salegentibacter mishustinae]